MSTHPDNYVVYRFEELEGKLKKAVVDWKDPKEGEVVVKVIACGVCGRYVLVFDLPSPQQADYPCTVTTSCVRKDIPRASRACQATRSLAKSSRCLPERPSTRSGSASAPAGTAGTARAARSASQATSLCASTKTSTVRIHTWLFIRVRVLILWRPTGVFRDGGYAEYATLRVESLVLVPEELDPAEVAPLLCAGVTTFSTSSVLSVRCKTYSSLSASARLPPAHDYRAS